VATLSYQATYAFTMGGDTTVIAEYSDAVTEFYVNDAVAESGFAAGDDANAGTSADCPMASLGSLIGRYGARSGATVHISDGTFVESVGIGGPGGLTIEGAGSHRTVLEDDPADENGYPPLYVATAVTVRDLCVTGGGCGIYTETAPLALENCVITGNGTGVWSFYDDPVITNCTFFGNGTGLEASRSSVGLMNCIFWGNDTEITAFTSAWDYLDISYCDIEGGQAAVDYGGGVELWWGAGNIDSDPLFADPENGDLHLCSLGGRWNSSTQAWVTDVVHSPCIDAGEPTCDCSNEPAPNGGFINIGAYGNTAEASKSTGPFITVTSPNGGETWNRGSEYEITWDSDGAGDVKIALYDGWTKCCEISVGTPNNGSYMWTIPADHATGTNYRVVVISQSVSGLYDSSDAAFTITTKTPEPYITVTSPNGGETWNRGSTYEITWDSDGAGNVKVALYRGASPYSTIVSETANDGSYTWPIPADHLTASDYRVVIISKSVFGLYDYSDGAFTITTETPEPYITVSSPNGGESWQAGTTHTIAWTSNAGGTVDISLYKGGVFDSAIATGEANDGAFSWSIPTEQAVGSDYRVRVTSTADATVTDESNADFSITAVAPFITVTSPNGGETWAAGSSYEITWDSDGAGNVKIYLYKGGTYYSTLSTGTPNDGSFTWAIPTGQTTGSDYRVVVQSATNGLYDYSDSPFTVAASP